MDGNQFDTSHSARQDSALGLRGTLQENEIENLSQINGQLQQIIKGRNGGVVEEVDS